MNLKTIFIYNLFSKYFIALNLIIFTYLSLVLYDLMILWFFLEITNFLFICLLNYSMKNKKMIFFYFIIQMLSSFIIIFIISLNTLFLMNNYLHLILISGLLIKLSVPPFHFWLPAISTYMPWNMFFILLTLQKILPFYLLSFLKLQKLMVFIILISCSIVPPYFMLNWNNLKTIMAYSSINQSGWMILLITLKNIIWFKYFTIYTLIMLALFTLFYYFKVFKHFSNFPLNLNILIFMFLLNLASMPPFSFFYLKWYSIFLAIMNNFNSIILIIMMISSFFMLYIYTSMLTNSLFFYKFKSKLMNFNFTINIFFTLIAYLSLFASFLIIIF
uniref:NADH dehydrogenase subunit 2 n=1 Tax=Carebara diversa TaxID=615681 RepID=UPI001EDC95FB|nr:NADH dehydrogenase subunit 2 [Carebara diversa]UIO59231.1 NADH dehydrogenase subunit 2 [Carebara diversa]